MAYPETWPETTSQTKTQSIIIMDINLPAILNNTNINKRQNIKSRHPQNITETKTWLLTQLQD
jgi:hypothetical protein